MASSFSTDLKLELMVTGENSGTWGDKTNTNLNLLQQAIAGYQAIALTSTNTTLVMTDATISNARNATIEFTGTLSAATTVVIPNGIEKVYNIIDSTVHSNNSLTVKTASGTGVLLAQGNRHVLYSDGTNVGELVESRVWRAATTTVTVQAGAQILANTSTAAWTLTLPASPVAGDEVSIVDSTYKFNTNNLTIAGNGSNIANTSANLVVGTQGAGFTLVYSGDTTVGWTYRDK
jgi:hypothetical protein